jgi:hypothetical protein
LGQKKKKVVVIVPVSVEGRKQEGRRFQKTNKQTNFNAEQQINVKIRIRMSRPIKPSPF